jgi:hypothetical protein
MKSLSFCREKPFLIESTLSAAHPQPPPPALPAAFMETDFRVFLQLAIVFSEHLCYNKKEPVLRQRRNAP